MSVLFMSAFLNLGKQGILQSSTFRSSLFASPHLPTVLCTLYFAHTHVISTSIQRVIVERANQHYDRTAQSRKFDMDDDDREKQTICIL